MRVLITVTSLLLTSFPSLSEEFCSIGVREQRQVRIYSDAALDAIPSILEECAMGRRLSGFGNSTILKKAKSFNLGFKDKNFFCGFGTKDVWRIATHETSFSEAESLDKYLQNLSQEMNEMIRHSEISVPWSSRKFPISKSYSHIFGG